MNAGRFLVTDELLHDVLMLPAGCRVTNVTFNHQKHAYEISVVGDAGSGLPAFYAGENVEPVKPHYRTKWNDEGLEKTEFIGWYPHPTPIVSIPRKEINDATENARHP